MSEAPADGFRYPSTRYSGSKRKLLEWIWENVKDLQFNNVLDVFGGTGSVSLLFKKHGKTVYYNDLLQFNQVIAKAIIENNSVKLSEGEINSVTVADDVPASTFIRDNFSGLYFRKSENIWLDAAVQRISKVPDEYKRSILMAALFQACLAKRPFNLFHRENLYIRTAKVNRSFGNKTTWETPFPVLLKRFALQYNNAVFSNGRRNKVIGGLHALDVQRKADMVYLDPPYFSSKSTYGTNYLRYYHFLEGLADYKAWHRRVDPDSKIYQWPNNTQVTTFTRKCQMVKSFEQLIANYSDSIVVLSYQSEGVPSKEEIVRIFRKNGRKVKVFEKEHRYVLSPTKSTELLFVTTN